MSFGFPELASIRLGYGLSPLMPPPADAAAVLASVAHAGPGPEAMTTAEASRLALELRRPWHRVKVTNTSLLNY